METSLTPGLYRQLRVAIINSSLDVPYHSYGDHWVDGFQDAGCLVSVFPYDKIPYLPVGYDLYFFVEVRYTPAEIPWYACPRVLYSWDAHILGTDYYKQIAGHYDKICLASKIVVEELKNSGISNAMWVPEACNPRLHKDLGIERPYEIGLVGRHNDTYIRQGLSKSDFIKFLETSKYKSFFKTEIWGNEYVNLMNQSILAFDRTITNNVGTRVFESAAMGCVPLWSDQGISDQNGMSELMTPGLHYASYNDTIDGLIEVVDDILSHPDKAKFIIENAKKHVLTNHTYAHRAKQVLEAFSAPFFQV